MGSKRRESRAREGIDQKVRDDCQIRKRTGNMMRLEKGMVNKYVECKSLGGSLVNCRVAS